MSNWETLKTVLKTDRDYWSQVEGKMLLAKDDSPTAKLALSVAATSIGLIDYYIEIVRQIETGELVERNTPN